MDNDMPRKLIQVLMFTVFLLIAGFGCGGSTTGTGGVVVTGKLLTVGGTPIPDVTVSILNTGDVAVSGQDGAFSLSTDLEGEYDFEFDLGDRKVKSKLKDIPPKAKEVKATFKIDDESEESEASEIEITEDSEHHNSGNGSGGSSSTPKPTRHATSTPSPAPSGAPTPIVTPTATPDPTVTPSLSPTPSFSPTPSPTRSRGGEREETGIVTAIDSTSITVGSTYYVVNSSTEISIEGKSHPKITDLKVGDRVHIHGQTRNGILVADEIEKE